MTRPITTPPKDRDVSRAAERVPVKHRTREVTSPVTLEAAIARADALFAAMQTPEAKAAAAKALDAVLALPGAPGYVVRRKP